VCGENNHRERQRECGTCLLRDVVVPDDLLSDRYATHSFVDRRLRDIHGEENAG
jgi:hypothetical protein